MQSLLNFWTAKTAEPAETAKTAETDETDEIAETDETAETAVTATLLHYYERLRAIFALLIILHSSWNSLSTDRPTNRRTDRHGQL